MLRPGSPLSRLAAIAVLLVVVATPYFLVVVPWMSERDQVRERIEDARHLIRRYEARREDVDALKSKLAKLGADRTTAATFIRARNPSLAAADLQGRVSRLVGSLKGKMTSAQPVPSGKADSFERVTIRARMNMSTDGLRRVLHKLESGKPYLFLDNVVVRRGVGARRPAANRKVETPDLLDVRFDVHGFIWAKGAK